MDLFAAFVTSCAVIPGGSEPSVKISVACARNILQERELAGKKIITGDVNRLRNRPLPAKSLVAVRWTGCPHRRN